MNFFTEFKTDVVSIASEFVDRFKNIPNRGAVVLEQLPTAITGFVVVIAMLALIAVAILIFSKVISAFTGKKKAPASPAAPVAPAATAAAPAGNPLPANTSAGSLDLVDVDEKTAAVIMAIVSNESGIPLNRLAFKSIKKMEDK